MIDNNGRVNGDAIWSKQANWVSYQGVMAGRFVSVMLMAHPDNATGCWWHARDYGLLTANPFGPLNAADGGRTLTVGQPLRLRFAIQVLVVPREAKFAPAEVFLDYAKSSTSN